MFHLSNMPVTYSSPKVLDLMSIQNFDHTTFLISFKALSCMAVTVVPGLFWTLAGLFPWSLSVSEVTTQTPSGLASKWGQSCCQCSPSELSWVSCIIVVTVKTVCTFHSRLLWYFKSIYSLIFMSLLLMEFDYKYFTCKEATIQERLSCGEKNKVRDVKIHWKVKPSIQRVEECWLRGKVRKSTILLLRWHM